MKQFESLLTILLLSFLLLGCADTEEIDYTHLAHWNGQYKIITPMGYMVNYENYFPLTDDIILNIPNTVEQAWRDTQDCAGIYLEPDRLFVINFTYDKLAGHNGTIVFHNKTHVYTEVRPWDLTQPSPDILKHEMIHYLLYLGGESMKHNNEHKSELFDLCA